MTITERNRKLAGLREQMDHYSRMGNWCREEMLRINREYKEQDLDLYKEMFNAN